MAKLMRSIGIVGAAVAGVGLSVAAVPAGAAPTHTEPPASLSIHGDLHLTPQVRVLSIETQGTRDSKGATTGTYEATVLNGMDPTPIKVSGPVTCIDVGKDASSLVYPISDMRPFGLPQMFKDQFAVQITVRPGPNGQNGQVGVMGPMRTDSFHGCAPQATPFAFTGTVQTTG